MTTLRLMRDRWSETPIDPDIELITHYLANELHGAEAEAVEDRLADDEAFFEKVSPVIKAWTMPVRYRYEKREGEAGSDKPGSEKGKREAANREATSQERPRWWRVVRSTAKWAAMAACMLFTVYAAAIFYFAAPMVREAETEPPYARLGTKLLPADEVAVTGANETRTEELADGTSFKLGPGSRLSYAKPRWLVPFGLLVRFEGSAEITVPNTAGFLRLVMPAAAVKLQPGRYMVASQKGSEAAEVTVVVGSARLGARGVGKDVEASPDGNQRWRVKGDSAWLIP